MGLKPDLEKMEEDKDFKKLLRTLKYDEDNNIRNKAAEALIKLGWYPKNTDEKAWYDSAMIGKSTPSCPKCNAKNEDSSLFCLECGSSLTTSKPGYYANSYVKVEYAGFWKRFGAYLIDSVILIIIFISVVLVSIILINVPLILKYQYLFDVFSFLLLWIYFAGMESSVRQATIGKNAMVIIVTDMNGDRISFARATIRYFSGIIVALPLFFGFIMICFTKKKQGLHDIIAGCLVVRKLDFR